MRTIKTALSRTGGFWPHCSLHNWLPQPMSQRLAQLPRRFRSIGTRS